ncbi:MAG TPA: SDR family oxidoreductase [Chitinophagaceae bacterium]|nr:SDR family oxidoreductase [Chitinophagaceae bacterium]
MNVLITGASRGIGKAIAEIFASSGYDLLISSRNEMALYKAMEEFQTKYSSVSIRAKAFDLSDQQQAKDLGKWCLQYAVPDILVNNAGLFEPGSVYNETAGTLESQLSINLHSAYHLTRSLLPKMMERKSGHIFNMCSIASLDAYDNGGAYSISKFALYGFSKNLREEMKPHNIKVTAIHPGAVLTDSWEGYDNSSNRIMVAEDIAKMVFVCTQLSPAACVEEILIRPQLGDL